MKKVANKKFLTAAFAIIYSLGARAESTGGIAIGDTAVFSLFVLVAIIFLMIIYAQINAFKGILENKELWMNDSGKKNSGTKKALAIIGLMLASGSLMAQETTTAPLIKMTSEMYWIMIGLCAFLLGIIITLHYMIRGMIRSLSGVEEEADMISQFTASITDAVPIEREGEVMLDHNYDGIRELDNNLPPWWKYGFYITIIFSVVYMIHYHLGSGPLMIEEYETQVAEAEAIIAEYNSNQANQVDESNLTVLTDGARLEAGKKVYIDNCKICHGEFGEGIVGPNLTDKYWKHGGGIKEIYNTIKVGVPDKGMISWESQLTPGQMHEVSSYILGMQGTNPPNGKGPEGDLWEESALPPTQEASPEETPQEAAASEEKV